ncbi:DUF397 domain-containing protein [Actinokineospora auranticolor]|nr:DUF397 domain-containing protein [Actinokineospora auranticolor]
MSWRKSSFSGEQGSACVEVAWRKSSYSGQEGTSCVEVAWTGQPSIEGVLIRDSKNSTGPTLAIPTRAWHTLLATR